MASGTALWPGIDLADLMDALDVAETGEPGRYRARNVVTRIPSTLGSQVLAQTVLVAERTVPGMAVQSLQGVFPRGGVAAEPVGIDVEVVQSGRALATVAVTFQQEGREHYRAQVMLSRDEPDFLRHHRPRPDDVPGPEDCEVLPVAMIPWEVRTFGGAAALAPDLAGPPSLDVWMRCTEVADTPSLSRALLAHGTEGFLGPVALRPYPQAEIDEMGGKGTSVMLTQNVSFHEPFSIGEWLLLRCESVYAGRSRMHGRTHVYAEDGRLVASVMADGLMRVAAAAG
ncbi:acyl-CoA thioesterase [Yinghuangia seranimata]|uniref:acyl-CoA thioesterase n=1 Tax=Yinghuangia seranimata TaxID=408067 RepID=UPI00248AAF64|nr:acyl-CoA thioesterase domain-containing protein [Yinghuangia seranimata]MDI2131178.1 thioesterase family protein [Yinghuangia seranimata]